jgi:STE24 endopeptidase
MTLSYPVRQSKQVFLFYVYPVLFFRHGFNKQTPAFYVKDQIKSFIITQIIVLPLVAAIVKVSTL